MMREVYRLDVIPESDAYAFAFSQSCVTPHRRRMLLANLHAPASTIGARDMAAVIGTSGYQPLNGQYGRFAHMIADLLDIRVPTYSLSSSRLLWLAAIVEVARDDQRSAWTWTLYPQAQRAIRGLDWQPG